MPFRPVLVAGLAALTLFACQAGDDTVIERQAELLLEQIEEQAEALDCSADAQACFEEAADDADAAQACSEQALVCAPDAPGAPTEPGSADGPPADAGVSSCAMHLAACVQSADDGEAPTCVEAFSDCARDMLEDLCVEAADVCAIEGAPDTACDSIADHC
jgi:hypothetical protein